MSDYLQQSPRGLSSNPPTSRLRKNSPSNDGSSMMNTTITDQPKAKKRQASRKKSTIKRSAINETALPTGLKAHPKSLYPYLPYLTVIGASSSVAPFLQRSGLRRP